jgi:muramidase (phage lysozyme)
MMMVAKAIKTPKTHLMELWTKPEIRAFLDTIAYAEGTDTDDGYKTAYGGKETKDTSDHPGQVICKISKGKKLCSSATGRYQFLHSTWDELAKKYNFTDFGAFNQDLAAIALLHNVNAIEDIENKRIDTAISKANRIWASFPGAPYGQPTKPLAQLLFVWNKRYTYYNGVTT